MFSITTTAAREVLATAVQSDAVGMSLRVAARHRDDGSIEYGMGFDEQREGDEPTAFDGLTVLIGSPSRPLLAGTVLDYVELEPGQHSFVFIPPGAHEHGSCSSDAGEGRAGTARSGGCGGGGCGGCR